MATAAERFFRGGVRYTVNQFAPIPFHPLGKRSPLVHVVDTSGGVSDMYLPDARKLQPGGPYYVVAYPLFLGGDPVKIYDHTYSNEIVEIEDEEVATLWLLDNTTEDGIWAAKIQTPYRTIKNWSDDFSDDSFAATRALENNSANSGADFAYDAGNDELDVSQSGATWHATAHYSGWPQIRNVETEAFMRIDGGNLGNEYKVMMLVRWDPVTRNGYAFSISDSGSATRYRVEILKITGGSMSLLIGAFSHVLTVGDPVMVKGQLDGAALKIKVWTPPAGEPGVWLLSTTDSSYTGEGFLGYGHMITGSGPTTDPGIDDFVAQQLA